MTVLKKGISNVQDRFRCSRPSSSLFARLMAAIDSLLMASAEISNHNGDLPRFGL
ncbi:hypothetical protein [Bradyrhizobium sp. BR 1432]|uniref:hypothetical protein n=1 Tax=Bradyrhizobium sp. BR 1432 TaxID=3447966 RepID=UPI003EE6C53E